MRLAYSTLACPSWTVEQMADAVPRFGFDGIEWRLAGTELLSGQSSVTLVQRVVDATRSRGLLVPALDSSCRLVQPDAAGREATLREAQSMLNLAVRLEAPAVRVFGGRCRAACQWRTRSRPLLNCYAVLRAMPANAASACC